MLVRIERLHGEVELLVAGVLGTIAQRAEHLVRVRLCCPSLQDQPDFVKLISDVAIVGERHRCFREDLAEAANDIAVQPRVRGGTDRLQQHLP
eukprot:4435506-Pyramimonas_sp.AAC.1